MIARDDTVDRVDQSIRATEQPPIASPAIDVSSNLDIIASVAAGYRDVESFRPFIATLRRTGATCPVFLGISAGPEYEPVRRYLLDNAVNYFTLPPVSPAGKICHGVRFAEYARWLREFPFRYALMLDFRDAYFQRDPFQDIERHMRDCDLYLMSEFQLLTVGNHPNRLNHAWVAEVFGEGVADSIADRPILNSGAVMGRKGALLALAESIGEITSSQNHASNDQGTLNYLAHTGRLLGCGRVKTVRAGESLVNNCGFSEIDRLREERGLTPEEEARIAWIPRDARGRLALPRDHQGWVLDDDGNVSPVVHQYDRFPEMDDFVWRLSRYDAPDDVFVARGDRAYRGEKYVLSSRQGLRPDAVPRLIARLKGLSTAPKPLLLLDSRFKRGFVFAHGILNVELLYEAEAFRRAFFTAAPDEERCARFCRRWGYEPMFVDEDELFVEGAAPPGTDIAQGFREARAQAERW